MMILSCPCQLPCYQLINPFHPINRNIIYIAAVYVYFSRWLITGCFLLGLSHAMNVYGMQACTEAHFLETSSYLFFVFCFRYGDLKDLTILSKVNDRQTTGLKYYTNIDALRNWSCLIQVQLILFRCYI